ncbi:MAG: molybdopterin-dependent oxidoreductase, partial [Sneathiella sp.]|nr:molybdopterin-dependent oxidoreductase [Sneathiella sp.]
GSDTVPGTYEDLELADVIVLVGSNLAWCHPVIYQRIAAAKSARPEMKVVLIDPRRTMTADIADIHLPIKPDGDVALFQGLLSHLAVNDQLNAQYIAQHTTGFDTAIQAANSLSDMELVTRTGLTLPALKQFYQLFGKTEKIVTVYSQGVNQSAVGTDKVTAILNCHLATGRIGREGMGPFSITGQPNAMGGREVGGLANMLACHMDIENKDHQGIVQSFWKSPIIAQKPGLKAVDMFQAVMSGDIKAIWIMATNPVDSLPDANFVKAALQACPFVVVSDIQSDTDTTALAHVKLPSLGWGEKDGLVTNSERRMSRQRAFLNAPGEAKADWWQFAEIAKRMGFESSFTYTQPADIAREFAKLSAAENNGTRDFDIGVMSDYSDADYNKMPPLQWPIDRSGSKKDKRFFGDGIFFTPDGKARFHTQSETLTSATSEKFPFTLNTGRIRDHWHTMTRTGKSARLSQHITEPFAEVHPVDALQLGILDNDLVEVSSELSSLIVRANVTNKVQEGSVFVPIHWTDQFASSARVDTLIPSIVDPYSGQPASKNTPCNIRPYAAALHGFMISKQKPETIPADYWAAAKCEQGWRIEFALKKKLTSPSDFAASLLKTNNLITYNDKHNGSNRYAAFDEGRLVAALYLSEAPLDISRSWVVGLLGAEFGDMHLRYRVVAGRPPADTPDIGAIVCSCFSVGRNQIRSAILDDGCMTTAAIGECLKAGTNCGSCRSEIQELINLEIPAAAE